APLFGMSLAVLATVLFYQHYSPWTRLLANENARNERRPITPEKALDLALPATNNVEQNQPWGEVRITAPGSDLKVTKVDVVPLHIEASANEPLSDVAWFSTINGATEQPHP